MILFKQDHHQVKRRLSKSNSFQSMRTAKAMVKGIEVVSVLAKESRKLNLLFDYSLWVAVEKLLSVV
ncbi:DDE-type integrase/transposase/recombinase [Lactiplantibacillus plantarum]|uniref:DDE-type integrase/transposase/recombinase n=1 Tax=Lactiplantibacillus plantarum TaxID=1590 RepID=UPI0035CFB833